MLRISSLRLTRGGFQLDSECIDVERGRVIAFWGNSGSGKTTLATYLARPQLSPDLGIRAEAAAIDREEDCLWGVVPQGDVTFSSCSVEINALHDVPNAHFEDLLALVPESMREALSTRRQLPGSVLSGGERRSLIMARALLRSPDVIVLDEPFTGIDEGSRDDWTVTLARGFRDGRMAGVLISHDPQDLVDLANDVYVFRTASTGHYYTAGPIAAERFNEVAHRLRHLESQVSGSRPS